MQEPRPEPPRQDDGSACVLEEAGDPYQWVARIYDWILDPWLRPLHRHVASLCRREGASRIIDLCCGTGAQCRRLYWAGFQPTGVDLSPAMIREARRKSPAEIALLEGDAAATPFATASFDCAVISLALHEKPGPARLALLREAARLVRGRGVICVSDFLGPPPQSSRLGHMMRTSVERVAGRAHFACYRDYLALGAVPGVCAELGWSAVLEATFHRRATGVYLLLPEPSDR